MSDATPVYTMKIAANLSGLNPHTIRVWERRYGAVLPNRSQSDRRLYSAKEVHRLRLLREATRLGHGIRHIATLPDEELQRILSHHDAAPSACEQTCAHMDAARRAVLDLNPASLERVLYAARAEAPPLQILEEILTPLLRWVGDEWEAGRLTIAQEHAMSAVLAPFLVSLRDSAPSSTEAPRIVIGTPSGHLHEFGAQMAAIVAAAEGWQVIFLGTNLPVEEFALAAHRTGARVVALSMIYPKDTPRLAEGLQRLSAQIPEGGTLIVGGNAARAYLPMMLRHGLRRCDSLEDFRYLLRDLRSGPVN